MKGYLILILILLTGCSTLKRTLIYSALSGGLAGGTAGAMLSPNKASQGANAALFGAIGAGVVALTGYALYKDDPRNYKLKHMLDPNELAQDDKNIGIGLGPLNINANLEKQEALKVPIRDLPDQLKGKVKKQYLIKYQSKERYVNKGSKTYYIPSFEVYEHAYDEVIGEKDEQQDK